jgi:hypothetical protein
VNDILDEAQGWYLDPYGLHEQRWFSAGRPTALVRDGSREAHDLPPDGPPPHPLVPAPEVEVRPADLYDAKDAAARAFRGAFGDVSA